jgi:ketosteroid isomerase-like protein
MYSIDDRDRVAELRDVPQSSVGAPLPLGSRALQTVAARINRLAAFAIACSCIALPACTRNAVDARAANAGLDSLNTRLAEAYRRRDPAAYAALFTDTALFEWPAFNTVRGPAALAAMARDNWAAERDVELRLHVASRRFAPDHATEFGAFEQSWSDSAGVRRTEYGRYVSLLVPQKDGSWRLDRFLGFEDSTRTR